ncbi:MAG: BLUF domain-containing protein [Pseudomonadota bacterium]
MLQLVYVSTAAPGAIIDPEAMLAKARHNNRRDGITGMLFSDGVRFLQAMEGPVEHVQRTFDRIRTDSRHRALVVLSKREIAAREFGDWDMAYYDRHRREEFVARVYELTANAAPDVRATIEGFVALRTAMPR